MIKDIGDNVIRFPSGPSAIILSMITREPLPKPDVIISGVAGNRVTAPKLSSSPGLIVSYGSDFGFNAKPRVLSFTYETTINGMFTTPVKIDGYLFDKKAQDTFKGLKKGSRVIIDNIIAEGPDGKRMTLSPISLIIN